MRICIVTHSFSPWGHLEADLFERRGHEVEIFSLSESDRPNARVPVRVFGPRGFAPRQSPSRLPYLKMVPSVRRAVRQYAPDILMGMYLTSAGVVACLTGHRRIVISALGSDVLGRVHSRIWRAVFRWEARRAVIVHTVSEQLAETLVRRVGVDPDKILVGPIGVDTDRLGLIDPSVRPHCGQILCTRAHTAVYDQATLIRALVRLKQRGVACRVTFLLIHSAHHTRQLAIDLGVEDLINFVPPYRYEQLPEVMRGADVYVSCSLSDGTSSALLEALSTGTFPVVSDIPANRPWVRHGDNGLLFPVGDDAALADCVAKALADPDRRARAADVSRRIVMDRGDARRQADKLLAAFERCLAGEPPGGG